MDKVIIIAKEFSRSPSGRYLKDGPHSGTRFREEILFPALMAGSVEVVLDGVLTLGSSFLDEAFGGLVREKGLSSKTLREKLVITSKIQTYASRVWSYIEDTKAYKSV
jgi:hypothetical protein